MSEFYCFEGHSVPAGELSCSKCGSGIGSTDGKSLRECQDEEDWSYEEEEEDEE